MKNKFMQDHKLPRSISNSAEPKGKVRAKCGRVYKSGHSNSFILAREEEEEEEEQKDGQVALIYAIISLSAHKDDDS